MSEEKERTHFSRPVTLLDAEILKVAHHGSSSSTSPAFLARVRPETRDHICGQDNPYGHPHTEALDLLKSNRVSLYRTDLDGTVVVRTDGMSYSVKTETIDRGIWSVPVNPGTGSTFHGFHGSFSANPETRSSPQFYSAPPPSDITVPLSDFSLPQIGNSSGVFISATQFNAPGDDRQNLNGEWVRLTNGGEDIVLISGWTLSDTTNKTLYTFPAIFLEPGETITVFSGSGTLNKSCTLYGEE